MILLRRRCDLASGKLTKRLANEGKMPLKTAEIKVGAYFGEDDIIRFTNDFGHKADSQSNRSTCSTGVYINTRNISLRSSPVGRKPNFTAVRRRAQKPVPDSAA